MTLEIAKKEILEFRRDGRFRAASAMVLGLLLFSLALGIQRHRELRSEQQQAQSETREHWLQQGKKNPHSAAHYGVYAFKPVTALSLLERGEDQYTGVAVWLEAHKQNEFKYKPARDSNSLARMGEFTAATVLQLFLPLLIVLMSFSAFSGEKEQGTLRLLLSLGVPLRQLALGKALGVAGGLGLILVPSALLGSAALWLGNSDGSLLEDLPRMGGMTLSYLAYFVAFIGLSLGVSAVAKSSRLSLVTLLAFWIFNGLAAPRLAADLSRAVYPAPSSYEFTQRMDAELKKGFDAKALEQKLLAQYKVASLKDLPVNYAGIALEAGEEHGNEVYDAHFRSLWDIYGKQERLQQALSVAAPLLAVRSLSMAFAGTDFTHFSRFASAAEQYRRQLIHVMNEDITVNSTAEQRGYMSDEKLWKKVPEFHYDLPSVSEWLSGQSMALSILAFWSIAGMGAAAWAATQKLRLE